jgi:hypothetical protein
MFSRTGWAYDLKTPSPSSETIRRMVQSSGEGGHFKWGDVRKGVSGVIGKDDGDNFELLGAARKMSEETLIRQERVCSAVA